MKKLLLLSMAVILTFTVYALPKALYVVKGDTYAKYNFGLAGDLRFTDGGNRLWVSGYSEAIDLTGIDYITFEFPQSASSLTASQNKERMLAIGDELNQYADAYKQGELLRSLDNYFKFADSWYSQPPFWDHIYDDDFDPHRDYEQEDACRYDREAAKHSPVEEIMGGLKSLTNGDVAAFHAIMQGALQIYRAEDFYGSYEPIYAARCWRKTGELGYLEFRWPDIQGREPEDKSLSEYGNNVYTLQVKPVADYTDWTTSDFVARIPHAISIKGYAGSKELYTCDINFTNIIQDEQIDMDCSIVANNATMHVVQHLLNGSVTQTITATVDNKKIVDLTTNVYGANLLSYEQWKEDVDLPREDETGNWIDYGDRDSVACDNMARRILYGNTRWDILEGRLQAKARFSQLAKIHSIMSQDSWVENGGFEQDEYGNSKYYPDWETMQWDENRRIFSRHHGDMDVLSRKAAVLNDFCDGKFYYDGTAAPEGFLGFEADEYLRYSYLMSSYYDMETHKNVECSEPYTEEVYYGEVAPTLIFPDGTEFRFDDFFTVGFSRLVDDIDQLINDYETITGQNSDPD